MSPTGISRRLALAAIALCLISSACNAQTRRTSQPTTVVLDNVHVIPFDTERVIRDARVVVRGQEIVQVGPRSSVTLPAGATRIDGGGGYVIPGMTDMHVHLYYGNRGFPSYLAYGVTTVANLNGTPDIIDLREGVREGRLLGPTIYTAGPTISGSPPGNTLFIATATPDDARTVVRQQRAAGYDFLKIYTFVTPEVYAAVLDEARRVGIAVVGHVPPSVGVHGVLAARQSNIAHVEEIIRTGNETRAQLDSMVAGALANGVTITPNIFAYSEYLRMVADLSSPSKHAEARYQAPGAYVENLPNNSRANRTNLDQFARMLTTRRAKFREVTKLLANAGVPLFVGTDTEIFGFAGHSAQLEVFELVEAGLTPYQALAAATRAPGEFIKRIVPRETGRFGTIVAGARADLVLLPANPLEDIQRLTNVAGVMVRGRWLSRDALGRLRDSVATLNVAAQRAGVRFDSLAAANRGVDAVNVLRALPPSDRHARPIAESILRRYGRLLMPRDTAGAMAVRRLAVEYYPNSHSAHAELAMGLLAVGDTTGAVRHLDRSLEISPTNADPRELRRQVRAARPAPR